MWGWHQMLLLKLLVVLTVVVWTVDSFQVDRGTTATTRSFSSVLEARPTRHTGDVKRRDKDVVPGSRGRRAFLQRVKATAAAVACTALLLGEPGLAQAKYGDASTIVLPNYIEFLEERARVADPSTFLYQGADPVVLLKRLVEAATKLEEIPELVNDKKWSAIGGILMGPLGTLGLTLNQIQTAAPGGKSLASSVKQIKADLLDIGVAASKKSKDGCIQATDRARTDLAAFAKAAFPSP